MTNENQRAIRNVTLWGAGCNFVLVGLKFVAGIWGNSQVLVADAVHSLSDLLTDLAVLIGARYWTQPADKDHPYGHAKIETLVTLFIGVVLMIAGGKLVFDAVLVLRDTLREHTETAPPGHIALVAALVSIVVKEALYRVTARVGRKCHSSAVVANAWHHRTDALSSIPAALAVIGALTLGPTYSFLDPAGTIVVGGMIVYAAWVIIYPTFHSLMDMGTTAENIEKIRELVLSCPPATHPHRIRTRYLGANGMEVDLHIHVDGRTTVLESHALSHRIEEKLLESDLNIVDVTIHIEPSEK